jgi:esterase/lipase
MKKISFRSDGYELSGNLFLADEPKKLSFLLIQGWTGHQNLRAAQALADLGFTCMTYDMHGNGDSEGNLAEFSRADFVKDAKVAYDYLNQRVGDSTKIGVVGSSFGSYTAVLLSEKRKVFCLSLRVPANYPDEDFNKPQLAQHDGSNDFKEWRSKEYNYSENKALTALHNFNGPVQIIEAENDELVAAQVPKNYAAAMTDKTKLKYEVMENAPHRLENDELQEKYEKLLTAWVNSLRF